METTARVGRNEPCPCGSGKKYKVCCEGRVDVVPEAQRSRWPLVGVGLVGVAIAGVIALRFLREDEPAPSTANTVVPSTTLPVTITPSGVGAPAAAQPPGPVPAGKVWSAEHGHYHDAPGALSSSSPTPIQLDANGVPSPAPASQPFSPGTPQPSGPAPAGKVWSNEHGHWHDAPAGAVIPQ